MGNKERLEELRKRKAEITRLLEEARAAENARAREEKIKSLEEKQKSVITERAKIVGISMSVDSRGVPCPGGGGLLEIELEFSQDEVYPMPILGCPAAGSSGRTREKYRMRGAGLTALQEFALDNKRVVPQILAWVKEHYTNTVRSNEQKIIELEQRNTALESEIVEINKEIKNLRNVEERFVIEIRNIDEAITVIVNGPSDEELAALETARKAKEIEQREKERAANEEKARKATEENKRMTEEANEMDNLEREIADAGKDIEIMAGNLDEKEQKAFLAKLAKYNKDANDERPLSRIAGDIDSAIRPVAVSQTEDSTSELLEQLSESNRLYKLAEKEKKLNSLSASVRANGTRISYFAYSKSRGQLIKLALIKEGFDSDDVTKVWASNYKDGDRFGYQYYYKPAPFSEVAKILAEVTKNWERVERPDVDVSEAVRRYNRNY